MPPHALATRARTAIGAAIWRRAARMVAACGPRLARGDVGALLPGAGAALAGGADDEAASDVDPLVEPPPDAGDAASDDDPLEPLPAVLSDSSSPCTPRPASPACPARLSPALDLIVWGDSAEPAGGELAAGPAGVVRIAGQDASSII